MELTHHSLFIFVVADNGEANIIAIPSVNAAAIPKVKPS
jgi:hypothetical protein